MTILKLKKILQNDIVSLSLWHSLRCLSMELIGSDNPLKSVLS